MARTCKWERYLSRRRRLDVPTSQIVNSHAYIRVSRWWVRAVTASVANNRNQHQEIPCSPPPSVTMCSA